MKTVISKVAGVTFEGRQEIIKRLRGLEPVQIRPEPSNPYDPNALAVWVALGPGDVQQIGYVPKWLAAEIAPHLEGESVIAHIYNLVGGFEKYDGEIASLGVQVKFEYPDDDGAL